METNANFVQILPQTKEEKVAMYMKHSKKEIIEMLLNCQTVMDAKTVVENKQNKSCDNCIHCRKIVSGYMNDPIEIRCLKSAQAFQKML